jgi:hypothetical protein
MTDKQRLELGPVWRGGKPILEHECTHPTSGVPLYPAFDDAFKAGCEIVAPEDLVVTRDSSSRPGDAFRATGQSGIKYWFGHLVRAPAVGTRFRKGETMGVVLDHNVGGGPHVHVGINIEDVVGKGQELKHGLHYTFGAGRIGDQLKELIGALIDIIDNDDGQDKKDDQVKKDDQMARLCNPLIQKTGSDAIYITDGQLVCYRWIPDPPALERIRERLRAAGLPDHIEQTDNLDEYGVFVPTPPSG